MLTNTEQALISRAQVDDAWSLLEAVTAFPREHPRDVDRAVELVATRLRADGLPANVATMDLYLSLPGPARVEVAGRTLCAKVMAMSAPVPQGLTAEAIYVPGHKNLIASVLDTSQDVGGLRERVAGRIVITDGMGGAGSVLPFLPLGAVGVIAINPGRDIHSGICTSIWGNPDQSNVNSIPRIPVLGVNNADGAFLKALPPGTQVSLYSELEQRWFPSKYVEVEIRGSVEPDKFVLLHGHIDSWDVGVGDNGTGVVTLYEVARMLWAQRLDLRRSVRVVWWPGHSTGRYAGSTWYADHKAIDLLENCVAHVNCDSPGCRWATAYTQISSMPEATAFVVETIKDATGRLAECERPVRAGDWSFNNLGITGMLDLSSTMPRELVEAKGYYGVGGNGGNIEWHTARDRLEIADKDILLTDTRLYALMAFRLAAAEILPFDFRPAITEYRQALQELRAVARDRLDLTPVLEALDALSVALESFHGALAAGRVTPQRANQAILSIQRTLVPAHFATEGRFAQDPALSTPPLPALAAAKNLPKLDPTLASFALTQLVRGRNRIVAAFREAARALAA